MKEQRKREGREKSCERREGVQREASVYFPFKHTLYIYVPIKKTSEAGHKP